MSSPVMPEYLLKGAAYALEQCGLLLRDANVLYRSGSYASSIALAAFAREELGRSRILLALRKRTLAGEQITLEQVRTSFDDHVTKQREGMLSTVIRAANESTLGKLLQSGASEALEQVIKRLRKRTPNERHEQRMSALYVEPTSDGGGWSRPAATGASDAFEFLQDAVNDYSVRRSNLAVARVDPELYEGFESLTDCPVLPPPEWPPYPGS